MKHKHEAVVVGGGVVGAAAALALSRQGLDVALVERGAPPAPSPGTSCPPSPSGGEGAYDPRVYALSPGTVRFLDSLGVWNRIAAQRVSPYGRMQIWDEQPDSALVFDAAELGVSDLGHIVEDGLLRTALWSALGGVTQHCNVQPRSLRQTDGISTLELSDGNVLEAPLVVVAEGADSPLREWAGIEPMGWDYPQRSIVCHVTTEQPHGSSAYQRFLPNGPLAFLPLADGRSSIVWSTESAEAADLLKLDDESFRERLEIAIHHRLGAITSLTPRLSFPLRLLHAREYVRPGLALVGDSAHVVHPLAGQGVNLGLADVQALAEVLQDARRQHREPGNLRVLQRYERRRQAGNLEVLALTDGLYRMFKLRTPGWDALRELGLSLVGRFDPLKRQLARRAMGL